jgi:hypothetical protein
MPTPTLPPGMMLCPFCGNGTSKKLKACWHCNHVLPQVDIPAALGWLAVLVFIVGMFLAYRAW